MMEILLFSLSFSGIGRTDWGSMAQIQSEIQFLGNDNLVYNHLRHQESLAAEHEACLSLPELGARGGGSCWMMIVWFLEPMWQWISSPTRTRNSVEFLKVKVCNNSNLTLRHKDISNYLFSTTSQHAIRKCNGKSWLQNSVSRLLNQPWLPVFECGL